MLKPVNRLPKNPNVLIFEQALLKCAWICMRKDKLWPGKSIL